MNAVLEKPKPAETGTRTTKAPRHAGKGSGRAGLLRGVALIAVLVVGAATINWWVTEGSAIESTDNAYVQSDIAVLGPRVDGIVASVPVTDNQLVHKGDVLWTLQTDDRQAQLDQAKASAAEQAAAVEVAQRQVVQAQAAIGNAEAAIVSARAEQARAVADAGRSSTLVGAGWTSRQANDLAVADRQKADAAVTSAEAQRAVAVEALAVAQAQLSQAQAKLATTQAQVKLAAVNLAYTTTTAPFDGVVGNKGVRIGQYVAPGQQLLALAPPTSQLYVVANFKETQLAHMKPGQGVTLTPDIDTSQVIHGTVDSVAPATGALFSLLPPENATGNFTKVVQRYPVKLVFNADEVAKSPWLRAGLSVTTDVDTRDGHQPVRGLIGSALHALGLR